MISQTLDGFLASVQRNFGSRKDFSYPVLIWSDPHLGGTGNDESEAYLDEHLGFLIDGIENKRFTEPPKLIVILGDYKDGWALSHGGKLSQRAKSIINKKQRLEELGVKTVITPGNHDERLRLPLAREEGRQLGIDLYPGFIIETPSGSFVGLHGDQFDSRFVQQELLAAAAGDFEKVASQSPEIAFFFKHITKLFMAVANIEPARYQTALNYGVDGVLNGHDHLFRTVRPIWLSPVQGQEKMKDFWEQKKAAFMRRAMTWAREIVHSHPRQVDLVLQTMFDNKKPDLSFIKKLDLSRMQALPLPKGDWTRESPVKYGGGPGGITGGECKMFGWDPETQWFKSINWKVERLKWGFSGDPSKDIDPAFANESERVMFLRDRSAGILNGEAHLYSGFPDKDELLTVRIGEDGNVRLKEPTWFKALDHNHLPVLVPRRVASLEQLERELRQERRDENGIFFHKNGNNVDGKTPRVTFAFETATIRRNDRRESGNNGINFPVHALPRSRAEIPAASL